MHYQVLTTLIKNAFGDYFGEFPVVNLTKNVSELGKPNPDLYDCYGKCYISSTESAANNKLASAAIKKFSS